MTASFTIAGCTNATGNIEGGQYILPTIDAGLVEASAEASAPVPDLVLPDNCNDGGANAGSRWQDLYACYFGTSGVASCAGTPGMCHGDSSGLGAESSNYVCPPGDATGCWMGMQTAGLVAAGQTPDQTFLFGVLRQRATSADLCSQGSCMPKQPATIIFGPDDVARIAAWINGGATNN